MSSTAPTSPKAGLAAVVDEHLRWLGQWHRAAFFPGSVPAPSMPAAFLAWVQSAASGDLADQPAIDRLVHLHEQMHRMAKLVLMRVNEGSAPSLQAYEAVVDKFDEFMALLRRFERAFSVAGSGIDPLTGLRNRTGLSEELERELNRFRRTGKTFCIAMCDLDRFKSVNDTYGHEAGDRVLVAAAGVVNRGIRSFDEAFRLGGEEILILLKDATLMEGFVVVERLRADLAATPITIPDGRTIRVTASFGLAESHLSLDADALIAQADAALYEAKRGGRNRVVRAPPVGVG